MKGDGHCRFLQQQRISVAYNSKYIHNSQSLFLSDTALHVLGVVTTHPQEHKATASTASGKHYTVIGVKF
jgi:hypothetical protein